AALHAWENAANGKIKFTQNTTASSEDIINLGFGDLAALGFTSAPGGTLAVGGGVFTHGVGYTITSGIAWLDSAETWDETIGNGHPDGPFDAFTVFAHEIGHALGLGHTDDLPGPNIMDGTYHGELTTLSSNDTALIQSIYDTTAPLNTFFDVAFNAAD